MEKTTAMIEKSQYKRLKIYCVKNEKRVFDVLAQIIEKFLTEQGE